MTLLRSRAMLFSACLLAAILAAVPTMMNPAMDRGFELGKQMLSTPFSFLALAALSGGGWLIGRGAVAMPNDMCRRVSWLFAGWLALLLISTVFSERPAMSIYGSYLRSEGVLAWLSYAAVGAATFAVVRSASTGSRLPGLLVDVLILAALVPILFAQFQRFGFDRYNFAVLDRTRAPGTIGNAVFLGQYCALVIPLALARLWQAWPRRLECTVWVVVTALLAVGLVGSQSRGPLLALVPALFTFAVLAAAYKRKPIWLVAAFAMVLAAATALVIINVVPAARHWAQQVPVAARMVVAANTAAATPTALATRSAEMRLLLWQVGNETLQAASPARTLIGYGPEVAYMHYYPHITDEILGDGGGGAEASILDRLHAEALDLMLNHGVLAWVAYTTLLGTLLWAIVSTLLPAGTRSGGRNFSIAALAGGAAAALVTGQSGWTAALVPAFCLGLILGCIGFMTLRAWRQARSPDAAADATVAGGAPDDRPLLIGGVSALLVFWCDAQISLPVQTGRLAQFALAGLLFALVTRQFDKATGIRDEHQQGSCRGVGFGRLARRAGGVAYCCAGCVLAGC
ncbi:MAG: O-antigen ligase family protein [Rhodocyclaceae bacterium]|nr:O-antigen ligase family protein [Rhodocyclaceae bacterium]